MKTKLARKVGIFKFVKIRFSAPGRPLFFQIPYRIGALTKTCWRFSEKFGSPKNYKIHLLNTLENQFLLWKLDIQNDWLEAVRKNQ